MNRKRVFYTVIAGGVIVTGTWNGAKLVREAIVASNDGDTNSLQQIVNGNLYGAVAIVALILLVVGAGVPGEVRARTLRRRFPSARVITGTGSAAVRDALRASGLVDENSRLPWIGFTLVVQPEGLAIWARLDKRCALLEWSAISRIAATELDQGLRLSAAMLIVIGEGDDETNLAFTMAQQKWLGYFPENRSGVQKLVDELDATRLNSPKPALTAGPNPSRTGL
ncbi:MAG: hypothetical protein QOH55_181 [Microbacteriaceae bacterium]|nr:hypothetical protein [Microbacteriaceae bacterium]